MSFILTPLHNTRMVCYHVCLFLTLKRGNEKKGENTEQARNRGAGSVNLMTAHQRFQIEPNSKPATLLFVETTLDNE